MSTPHDLYLHGLNHLREEVKAKGNHRVFGELNVFQTRLVENIEKARIQGDTPENEAKRVEIIEQLDKITSDLHNMSFYDYCQSISRPTPPLVINEQITIMKQTPISSPEPVSGNSSEELSPSDEPLESVPEFILAVKEYLTLLQMNLQKAKEVFNSDIISQEQCEEVLSSFSLFDCSDFPEYNPFLQRAKTQLQYFHREVKQLTDSCKICDDIDRPSKKTRKKLQSLVGKLNVLFYDAEHFRKQLDTIDMTIANEK